MSSLFADVIVPLPLKGSFTYQIPEEIRDLVHIGTRVSVQFGKKRYYAGIIHKVHQNPPENYKTKPIHSVLDQHPVVNEKQLKLWEWLADYYMCSIGEVMKAALPSGLKIESETKLFLNKELPPPEKADLNDKEKAILAFLEHTPYASISKITEQLGEKNLLAEIKKLAEKGYLLMDERIRESYKPKTRKYVRRTLEDADIEAELEKLKKATKQHAILLSCLELEQDNRQAKEEGIEKQLLLKHANASHQSLVALEKKGLFTITEKVESRLNTLNDSIQEANQLTDLQSAALKEIKTSFQKHDVTLLHGVTSSGKTELYFRLINEALEKGEQVLYLLPEIALTTQMIRRLRAVFGNKAGVYHSRFNDAERVEVYQNLNLQGQKQNYQIILGVRSSLFLPFTNLGLIIVDEEHESSYKQQNPAPRYHGRDTAIMLGKIHGAKTLLGSATPSIESYYNTLTGKYGKVELLKRYGDIQLPAIQIVDTIRARKRREMQVHFTMELIQEMEEALNQQKQVILFQNRRGFAPFVECDSCGWIPKCLHCDVSLTYHKMENNLQCHYCGHSTSIPTSCPNCNSKKLSTKGFGTEKIEDEIALIFPDAHVARLDLDASRKKNAYENILGAFEKGEIDILIGTQMVTKGLDFDNVSLVGILNADNLLNFPDFRAFERSYQLLAQVGGRAGRKHQQGKVIIQTATPDHSILHQVLDNNYQLFLKEELLERKNFHYPPFYRMIRITLKHTQPQRVHAAAHHLAKSLKKTFGDRILGPEKPLIARISNYHHRTIILKIEKEKKITIAKAIIQERIDILKNAKLYKSVQAALDVDPY